MREGLMSLVGKQVNGLYVATDQSTLYVVCGDAVLMYELYGECCSETWVADVLGLDALIGGTVSAVEDLELPDTPACLTDQARSRQDCDDLYGYSVVTEKGRCTIAFRNSSNGYYGGHVENVAVIDRVPDGAVAIVEDWSA